MDFNEAGRAICKRMGMPLSHVSERLGSGPSQFSSMLKRNNPSLPTLLRVCDALGYEVWLSPVGTRLPDGSFVIDEARKG